MATFTAYNIEPESSDDEEIDNTKEIQIEDALKLYQGALKYQSQGPEFYPQAFDAYHSLLESEIFKYPEAVSEWHKSSSQVQEYDVDDLAEPEEDTLVPLNANETSASTIPQIVYLVKKNYGELLVKSVLSRVASPDFQTTNSEMHNQMKLHMRSAVKQALQYFADALEQDDTDLELWRMTGRLASESFGSVRLLRFCLESILDPDTDAPTSIFDRLNLDQKMAKEDLLHLLNNISDNVSLLQIGGSQSAKLNGKTKTGSSGHSRKHLPELTERAEPVPPLRTITANARTWEAVGRSLFQAIKDVEDGSIPFQPGTAFRIGFPDLQIPRGNVMQAPTYSGPSGQVHPLSAPVLQSNSQVTTQPCAPITGSASQTTGRSSNEVVAPSKAETTSEVVPDTSSAPIPQSAQSETSVGALSTRKRSSASAGHDENPDGVRGRSKRIRARESVADISTQDGGDGHMSTIREQNSASGSMNVLQPVLDSDKYMFNLSREIFAKLEIDQGEQIENVQDLVDLVNLRNIEPKHPYTEREKTLVETLTSASMNWTNEKAQALLKDDKNTQSGPPSSTLEIFLDHLRNPGQGLTDWPLLSRDDGLSGFLSTVQGASSQPSFGIHQICFRWLEALFTSGTRSGQSTESMYMKWLWPPKLKEVVLNMIVKEDEHIISSIRQRADRIEIRMLHSISEGHEPALNPEDIGLVEMAETLYELHVDFYSMINRPSNQVALDQRITQKDRLVRWGDLAFSLISHYINSSESSGKVEHLAIRYLWAAALHVKLTDEASREHILLCWRDFQRALHDAGDPVVLLPNNTVMPEISNVAIDQELSKINTMDYFLKIFSADQNDFVTVIQSLEPVLELTVSQKNELNEHYVEDSALSIQEEEKSSPIAREMVNLLERGSTSLKLFLWERLRSAHESIGHTSKAVCCQLRCIDLIIKDMLTPKSDTMSSHERQVQLFKSLHSLIHRLHEVVERIMQDSNALDMVDYGLEQTLLSSLGALIRVVYASQLGDDFRELGVVLSTASTSEPTPSNLKQAVVDIRIRAFVLQYILLKDCMLQNESKFPNMSETLAEYLSSIHFALGMRLQCKDAGKLILRFALQEFVSLGVTVQYRFDLAQVIFDLYGWKLAPEVQFHKCPPVHLTRPIAVNLVDFVLNEARRVDMKDLIKSEVRMMIDKMQQLLGGPEETTTYGINRRLLNAYLKSPICPEKLYRSVRGIGMLSMSRVKSRSTDIAQKGWYFLLGFISLSRFKSQQRFSPSPTDDLDIAVAFFKQDLEHGAGKWETWYRLAQAYDAKLYEELQWSADSINTRRPALANLQRYALHSYTMAVAAATRDDSESREATNAKAQLFTDFGLRIYSSSREPLSMEAFSLSDFPRHFSSAENPLYKSQPFTEMKLYSAWKFASVLFHRAIHLKPDRWINYYLLTKCLWKMFRHPERSAKPVHGVQIEEIMQILSKAIQNLPERRDYRQDPTLEPHYKLVSIVHKLVHHGRLTPAEGSHYLQASPYPREIPRCDDMNNWEPYILHILKVLGELDKSNWHHRICARAAHVVYDGSREFHAAMGAKIHLSQQIFTKTMVLQVWKPENEMIGRHFVYTSRYVQFFMALLVQTNDQINIDALVRRVRKKPAEFYRFPALWEEMCTSYINLLRRRNGVTNGHDQLVFGNMNQDDFGLYTDRIQDWVNKNGENPSVRDLTNLIATVNDLKTRTNSGLLKTNLFDDLIADAYAMIFEKAAPTLRADIDGEGNRQRMSINHLTRFDNVSYDGPADSTPSSSRVVPPSVTYPRDPPGMSLFDQNAPPGSRSQLPPRGIVKRDILRRAETLLIKPPPPVTQSTASAPVLQPKTDIDGPPRPQPPLPIREGLIKDGNVDSGATSSVPGSVHDSADDESELSDLDDSRLEKRPMFPGLLRTKNESAAETEEEVEGGEAEEGDEVEEEVDVEVEVEPEPDNTDDMGGEAEEGVEGEGEDDAEEGGDDDDDVEAEGGEVGDEVNGDGHDDVVEKQDENPENEDDKQAATQLTAE